MRGNNRSSSNEDSPTSGQSIFYWLLVLGSISFATVTLLIALSNYQRTTLYLIGDDKPSDKCNDDNACTLNVRFGSKGTCTYEPFEEGHDCTDEDVCYNTSGTIERKKCCKGECIANRSLCVGVCQSTSDCSYDMFPVDYSQIPYYNLSCINGGACTLVTIQNVIELYVNEQPFLFNVSRCGTTLAERRSKCIQVHCDSSIYESICVYRYRCAKSSSFIPDNIAVASAGIKEDELHPLLINANIPNYFNDYMNSERYDKYNSQMKGMFHSLLTIANISNSDRRQRRRFTR
jgi:hypothetical protein